MRGVSAPSCHMSSAGARQWPEVTGETPRPAGPARGSGQSSSRASHSQHRIDRTDGQVVLGGAERADGGSRSGLSLHSADRNEAVVRVCSPSVRRERIPVQAPRGTCASGTSPARARLWREATRVRADNEPTTDHRNGQPGPRRGHPPTRERGAGPGPPRAGLLDEAPVRATGFHSNPWP